MMKLLTTLIFCLGLFGQMSVQEVIELAKSGASKEKIQDTLADNGVSFELDRKNLKTLKSAGLADWLIDELVTLDVGVYGSAEVEVDGYPRRYGSSFRTYHPFDDYWYDPWDPFYGSTMFFFSPYYWYRSWDFYSSGRYYPSYYRDYYRFWSPFIGPRTPSNSLGRRGYRNSVDDRVIGTARPRGTKSSASSSSSSSSRRTATSTSSRSSSSRSSSGGKVTRRGYKKN